MLLFDVYLSDLIKDPPDTTTVKEPFCLTNFSDKSAVYFARDTDRASSESNTCTFFFSVAMFADVDAFVFKQLNLFEQWVAPIAEIL